MDVTVRIKSESETLVGVADEGRPRWRARPLLALLFAFALVAAACGDSDDTADGSEDGQTASEDAEADESTETTAAATDTTEAAAGDDEVAEPAGEPATFEELEATWAANRASIVDMLTAGIEAGDYGFDGTTLRGPGNFEVDLSDCPSDWDDNGGLGDDEIRVGQSFVQSGPAAAGGGIVIGMELYFDYINSTGGVDGRQLTMNTLDDQYVATQTIENVDELLQSYDPFLIHLSGSPSVLATYGTINDRCVPNPFVATGHPAWGDPLNHPWTTGSLFSYGTEAVTWGNWIETNLADELPVVVGGAFIDNDFGRALELGFGAWAEENPDVVAEYVPVRFDATAPTVATEMTTIGAADPDVLLIGTTGVTCAQTIVEAGRSGLNESLSAAFTTSVCKPIEDNMVPAGDAADGWLIVGGGLKDTTDPNHTDELFISWAIDRITEGGEDPTVSFIGTGFFFAWPMVEAMRIAAELPGGLTRTNYLLTLRSIDLDHPMLLDGVSFSVNGAEDAYYIEGADISRYDAEAQSWNVEGDIVDNNGGTANCAWGGDAGCE